MDNLATQVRFLDKEDGVIHAGILYDDKIICGCCGGVFDAYSEYIEILESYEDWVDLTETIIGD